MRLILLLVILLTAACASKAPMEAPPAQADAEQTNPYEKYYTQLLPTPAHTPEPQVFRGQDRDADRQKLLEDGYDLLGYSAFEAGDVPPQMLTEQAAKVHADLVLVYTRRNGTLTTTLPKEARPDTDGEPKAAPGRLVRPRVAQYEYVASYWTKLPPPVLGLHVQNPGKEVPRGGLPVVAVIKDSPAASAEIRPGDFLKRIGDTELGNVDTLKQATRRYAGKEVEIVFERASETLSRTVVLNRASD